MGSEARARVLSALLAGSPGRYYLRDLARRVGLPPNAARRELEFLAGFGLALRTRDGRRIYYEANSAAPVLHELRSLVLKLGGIPEALRIALHEQRAQIQWAFIFGSMATGKAGAASDIDVFMVGRELSSIALHDALLPVQERLGREITTYAVTPKEFRDKRAQPGGFVRRVLAGPRIELIGDEQSAEAAA
jgi:predicted nucleotidyltransferase